MLQTYFLLLYHNDSPPSAGFVNHLHVTFLIPSAVSLFHFTCRLSSIIKQLRDVHFGLMLLFTTQRLIASIRETHSIVCAF